MSINQLFFVSEQNFILVTPPKKKIGKKIGVSDVKFYSNINFKPYFGIINLVEF